MYEIFGNGDAVTVRKNDVVRKPHFSSSIAIKGELNQKLRPLSVGSSKVLGDVSNKVKNTLTADAQSHLRSKTPCKSIKKTLFSGEHVSGDRSPKAPGIQSTNRNKSAKKVKPQITPKPTAKSSNLGTTKVPIFVDSWTDPGEEASDPELDEVFLPNQDELDTVDLEASPQKIYGYCEGYETPEEDVDGFLLEPMWNNEKDLVRIIGLEPSPETELKLADVKYCCERSPTDETNCDDPFEVDLLDDPVDDACYPDLLDDPVDDIHPLADLEW